MKPPMKGYIWQPEDEPEARYQQRKLFEKWCYFQGLSTEWSTLGYSKFYKRKETRTAWASWEASAELNRKEPK